MRQRALAVPAQRKIRCAKLALTDPTKNVADANFEMFGGLAWAEIRLVRKWHLAVFSAPVRETQLRLFTPCD